MEAVDVRGRFVWHELMTRDVSGAQTFYIKLMGWSVEPWAADPTYTVCLAKPGPTAGIFPITADFPAEMPAHWVSYIGTRDVDGTVAAAVRAGGSIVKEPEDIAGAGRYAVLKDPQGAIFAILDPEKSYPDEAVAPMGTFSWHELATSDHEAAFAFYSNLFGWEALQRMDMGPAGTYLIFGWNGVQRGGIYNKPADMPAPPNWLPYVRVPNSDSGYDTATGSGARAVNGPMDVPNGHRIATFFDPTGAAIAIVSMPEQEEAAAEVPKAAAKPVPKVKVQAKAKTKAKAKSRAKAKSKAKSAAPKKKKKAAKKPAAKKQVARKAARKPAKKSAPKKKSAAKKKGTARRKK